MVSVNESRLIAALHSGDVTLFEPTIDERGHVAYEDARSLVESRDESAVDVLASLSESEMIESEYTHKVYVCPSCQAKGLQYITACPACESTHGARTPFFEHDVCGHMGQSETFQSDGSGSHYSCPNCEDEFDSSELTIEQRYLCNDCGESFDSPSQRLWCIECHDLHPTHDAEEHILYEYTLSADGQRRYEVLTEARELLAETLETRGFQVEVETNISNDSDEPHAVHVHATDDLLGQQFVVDVHETVTASDVRSIGSAARRIGADPMLLVLTPSDDTVSLANQEGVTVLLIEQDGSFKRLQSTDADLQSDQDLVNRLTMAVDRFSWSNKRS